MSSYIESTRWVITWSKIKTFLIHPEYYKLKFEDEIEALSIPSKAMITGIAFDKFIQQQHLRSIGEQSSIFNDHFVVLDTATPIADRLIKIDDKIEALNVRIAERVLKAEAGDKRAIGAIETARKNIDELNAEWAELRQHEGKTVINESDYSQLEKMYNELTSQDLFSFSGNLQERFTMEYRGYTIGGTPDRVNHEAGLISDVKTTASLDLLTRLDYKGVAYMDSYIYQIALYQMLSWKDYHGEIQVVTKEDDPRSAFYFIDKSELQKARVKLMEWIDLFIDAKENAKIVGWPTCPREEAVRHPFYLYCAEHIQKEHIQLKYEERVWSSNL